ncbi:hypothetical protein ACFY19_16835 [Streptosporangium saharense]|uniref:Uncharacterized protein n=1 Tax=Streptosporangium saharense TaxID=1706840 RepID=A0A7W7QP03_9ACTN|nr:hypothetical protein [Streptosporangium saharense]MBB4917092.1 hypothetical protein [Streptosporangium saharense]
MSERTIPDQEPDPYEHVSAALRNEFSEVHPAATVTRCIQAAHYGALEVTGQAHPVLVERIARKHLEVLALAASEGG